MYEIRNFSSKLLSYHGSRFALGYVANEREAVIFAVGISASFTVTRGRQFELEPFPGSRFQCRRLR